MAENSDSTNKDHDQQGQPEKTTLGEDVKNEESLIDEQHQLKNEANQQDWYYDEKLIGEGTKPEWFNDKKYQTVSEQAKAQRELEKKLGSFRGAPEKYELNYPKDYPEELKVAKDNTNFQYWSQLAKGYNINNELFNEIYITKEYQDYKTGQLIKEQELKELGEDGSKRLNSIANWALNNLDQEEYNTLKLNVQSASMVKLLESLIDKTKDSSLPSGSLPASDLNQVALDKRVSDPRYLKDSKFRSETSLLFKKLYPDDSDEGIF